jgi:COMPASS component SWD3
MQKTNRGNVGRQLCWSLIAIGLLAATSAQYALGDNPPGPPVAGDQPILVLHTNAAILRRLTFSADGTRLAAGSDDGSWCVWDVTTGAVIYRKDHAHDTSIMAVAISADGKFLATTAGDVTTTAGDGAARVWEVATGKLLYTCSGDFAAIGGMVFSPDDKTLYTASMDQWVRAWDIAGQKEIWKQEYPGFHVSLDIDAEGKTLLLGSMRGWPVPTTPGQLILNYTIVPDINTPKLISTKTGEPVGFLPGEGGSVLLVKFLKDGSHAFALDDEGFAFWNMTDKSPPKITFKIRVGGGPMGSPLALSADGKILAFANENAVWVVADDGTKLAEHKTQQWGPAVAVSPDGSMVATGGNTDQQQPAHPRDPYPPATAAVSLWRTVRR